MIDRKIFLIFVVLFVVPIFLSSEANAQTYKCNLPPLWDKTTTGSINVGEILKANMFLCPTNHEAPGKPSCPPTYDSGVEPALFFGGDADYATQEGTDYAEYGAREAGVATTDWSITFETEGVCYQGYEGQYYVWFQVDTMGTLPSEAPTDGYCYGPAHYVDWDTEQYCTENCKGHSVEWADGLECCGDDDNISATGGDAPDCLKSKGSGLCVSTTNAGWEWVIKGQPEDIGDIKDLACANISIVANSTHIMRCAAGTVPNPGSTTPFDFTYIGKEDKLNAYACFIDDAGKAQIAQCADAPIGDIYGGIRKAPGESILKKIGDENVTYYCTRHREYGTHVTEWKSDLDNLNKANKEDCQNAKLPTGAVAGYKWTGSKCCSEADDKNEYYNDKEGYNATDPYPGGCWNSQYIGEGTRPPGRTVFDIINYKGGFEGCSLPETDPSLALRDSHTGGLLVNNNPYCRVLVDATGIGNNLFCSYSGNWISTDAGETVDKLSQDKTSRGCCAPDQCWNGVECIEDQSTKSTPETYDGYRCILGNWTNETILKYTPDGSASGYCPLESQCLVNPSEFADVNCIGNREYLGKNFCEEGQWTSRAKMLAVALLRYANLKSSDDYTLFCDTYENILNFYNYQVGGNYVLNYMGDVHCQGKACVNEFCVLRYKDGVAFGTSLNEPVNSSRSFLKSLDQQASLCDSARAKDNQYHRCGSSNIWYNENQGTLIQLPTDDAFGSVSWQEAFVAFIKNPFDTIKNWIVPRTTGLDFFDQTRMFTKVYAEVHGDKKVFAFMEEGQTVYIGGWPVSGMDYVGLEYQGMDFTPCDLIRHYDSTISCSADQTIFAQSRRPGQPSNLVDAWPDLTAKLRVR
ncbi:hypothetical protein JW707_05150 [Candidatus Woesearchaeota archaeon]|nr:hypothetical protein [Candidatus Woesearchaeota archaeon]